MLGRVIVHEMIHLLLPEEGHSTSGLMKGQVTFDDFDLIGNTSLGLSRQAQDRLREDVSRRLKFAKIQTADAPPSLASH
jgi:hypothetical protein